MKKILILVVIAMLAVAVIPSSAQAAECTTLLVRTEVPFYLTVGLVAPSGTIMPMTALRYNVAVPGYPEFRKITLLESSPASVIVYVPTSLLCPE